MIPFQCFQHEGDEPSVFYVEGRFNAEGHFEPTDQEDILCPDCQMTCDPVDSDVTVAK